MIYAAYGKNTTSNPRYVAAVKAQQAKERERATVKALEAPKPQRDVEGQVAVLKPKRLTPQEIIASVASAHGITVGAIFSKEKTRDALGDKLEARREAIIQIKRAYPRKTCAEIGNYFKIGRKSVETALKQGGLRAVDHRRINRAEVLRLIMMDMTPRQIAFRMGFTVETVLRVSFRARGKTLSDEKLEILQRAMKLRAKGMSYAKIERIVGVDRDVLQRDFSKMGIS